MAPHTAVGAAAKPPHALLLCSPTADVASRVCLQAVDEQGRLLATVRDARRRAAHVPSCDACCRVRSRRVDGWLHRRPRVFRWQPASGFITVGGGATGRREGEARGVRRASCGTDCGMARCHRAYGPASRGRNSRNKYAPHDMHLLRLESVNYP